MGRTREWQFDGIVGPTHNYAGLALGNLAAASNKGQASNPRNAALQGLSKMRFVHNLGMPQAFFPPQYRPVVSELRRLGFSGDLGMVLDSAFRMAPGLLASVFSSSFMWAANAATVTLSDDPLDGRLHLTPANLVSHYHRSIEAEATARTLQRIFHNEKLFSIHNFLPPTDHFGDEAAANHMAVKKNINNLTTHIFVYGDDYKSHLETKKYPARQRRVASESVARLHGLDPKNCLFFQQNPEAIDRGVFHNDVIAMNTTSRMIIHEQALITEHQNHLRSHFENDPDLRLYEVRADTLSIEEAVSTYLFNSQLLELPTGKFALVAPSECENSGACREVVAALLAEGMLDEAHYLDVRESMRNGGGPACLRLRIVMTTEQEESLHPGIILTEEKASQLESWVRQYYRDRLQFDDFRDPEFVKELDAAYAAFESVVGMPGLYDPQRLT